MNRAQRLIADPLFPRGLERKGGPLEPSVEVGLTFTFNRWQAHLVLEHAVRPQNHPDGQQIKNLLERFAVALHLLKDAPQVLAASADVETRKQPREFAVHAQRGFEFLDFARHRAAQRFLTLLELSLKLAVLVGVEVLES